jgi:hypothetical protein
MPEISHAIDLGWCDFKGVYLMGWVHLNQEPVWRACLRSGACEAAIVFHPRQDVLEAYPSVARDQACGFGVYLACPPFRPVSLHVWGPGGEQVIDVTLPETVGPLAPPAYLHTPPFERFVEMMKAEGGAVVEIGARAVSPGAELNAHRFQPECRFIGVDIHPAEGVDVVVDAHRLTTAIAPGSLAGLFSLAVMEHIAAPWVMAAEINRALALGGVTYHVVPQAFPIHEQPNDFWRISDDGLKVLFGPATGFEVLEAGMFEPVQIIPPVELRDSPFVQLPLFHAYNGAFILARKVAEIPADAIRWPLEGLLETGLQYPSHG